MGTRPLCKRSKIDGKLFLKLCNFKTVNFKALKNVMPIQKILVLDYD
jgi:hypothetical protein